MSDYKQEMKKQGSSIIQLDKGKQEENVGMNIENEWITPKKVSGRTRRNVVTENCINSVSKGLQSEKMGHGKYADVTGVIIDGGLPNT